MRAPLVAALLVVGASALDAQAPERLLREGIDAYERLEIGDAAGFLRRALGATPPGLSGDDHARALSYLAAAELLRDRGDSARSAFRQLVLLHPRFRPNPLTFPPPVLHLFEAVRQATKVVVLTAPDSAELRVGDELYVVRAHASSPHDVAATIERPDGSVVRRLYRGPIGDSLPLRWNGLTAEGGPVETAEYLLRVASLDPQGTEIRLAQVPLEIELVRREALPVPPAQPPDSLLLPEALRAGPAFQAFATGATIGLAAALLPALVGADDPAGSRFLVTAAVSFGGILGFVTRRPGTPLPENAAANRTLKDEWLREHDRAERENRTRAADVRLRIVSGTPQRIDRERP